MVEASRRKRILVADDDEYVTYLACRLLRGMGYDVESAADGMEALRKIEADRPDLLVLDLVMPGTDGWAVLERLKSLTSPPRVVVLTARTDYDTFTRGVQEGAAAYVVKPLHFHELVLTCQRVLSSAAPLPVDEEGRGEPRRLLVVAVTVASADGSRVAQGELVNLSTQGAQIDLPTPLDPGEVVSMALHISAQDVPLSLACRVVWKGPAARGFTHGVTFVNPSGEDARRLRSLLSRPD